jgi:hypothetical protein
MGLFGKSTFLEQELEAWSLETWAWLMRSLGGMARLFGANAAFEFGQFQGAGVQGWSSQRRGYFSERSWAFALAVFLTLKGEAPPSGVLKSTVADLTGKAMKYLQRNPELLTPLLEID